MTHLLNLLEHNWPLALLVAFLAAAAESIVVVGAFVPGTALLIALGTVAGLGLLPLWPLVAAAAAGAVLSDGLSYYVGRTHRDRLLSTWPFADHPRLIAAGERFFARYGWASIMIARFLPGVRAIVPVVAGTTGMRPGPFYLTNILSALVWAPAHILPAAAAGYGVGRINLLNLRTDIELLVGLLAIAIVAVLIDRWRRKAEKSLIDSPSGHHAEVLQAEHATLPNGMESARAGYESDGT